VAGGGGGGSGGGGDRATVVAWPRRSDARQTRIERLSCGTERARERASDGLRHVPGTLTSGIIFV
jgi:hypothetical protein